MTPADIRERLDLYKWSSVEVGTKFKGKGTRTSRTCRVRFSLDPDTIKSSAGHSRKRGIHTLLLICLAIGMGAVLFGVLRHFQDRSDLALMEDLESDAFDTLQQLSAAGLPQWAGVDGFESLRLQGRPAGVDPTLTQHVHPARALAIGDEYNAQAHVTGGVHYAGPHARGDGDLPAVERWAVRRASASVGEVRQGDQPHWRRPDPGAGWDTVSTRMYMRITQGHIPDFM